MTDSVIQPGAIEPDPIEPEDQARIDELAKRAELMIDRRQMIVATGRKLALPALAMFLVSRSAMGQTGSGCPTSGGGGGMMMMGM